MNAPQPDRILQVGLGFWASKALLSAVEMELFTELAKHPEDLETLQARLNLHPRSARDFLDALVSLQFLERRNGRYYNTPSTDLFLDKRKPSYIGGILEMANSRLYLFWSRLTTLALRTGLPQNETRDGSPNPFAALYAEPARPQAVPESYDRREPWRQPGNRSQIPVEQISHRRGCVAHWPRAT